MATDEVDDFDISKEYWAAAAIGDIGDKLYSRLRFNSEQYQRNPMLQVARKSYRFYYTVTDKGASGFGVGRAGEQGELSTLVVPHYQSLIRTTVSLVTQNRPGLQPVAINSDYRSQAQTKVASSVLDYYIRKDLEEKWQSMATQALVMGGAFMKMSWDTDSGEINPLTSQKAGDLKFTLLTPFDITFDDAATDDDYPWVITREYQNKYDLASKYKPWAKNIVAIGPNTSDRLFSPAGSLVGRYSDTDFIPVYEFYHKRTASLPEGRYVIFLNNDTVLYDGPLPTKNIPVVSIFAGKIYGTPQAFSPFWGLLGLQEATNLVASTIMTNLASYGGATLVYENSAGLSRSNLGPGLQGIQVTKMDQAPRVLEMTPSSSSAYQAMDFAKSQMQLVSGVNDVARGVPPPNVSSGTALALVQSQAYIANSDFEKQYIKAQENTGALLFEFLKTFAMDKRSISIINGKTQQYMMKEFTGNDVSEIDRVQVDVSSPLQRTPAGRMELAQNIVKLENPEDRQTFINIINTGRDDNLTEAPFRKIMNIRRENEMLLDGDYPIVVMLDDHAEHINEHKSLLDDPDVRMDQELVSNIMLHIDQHEQYWKQMTPSQLAIAGLQPLPPDMPMAPPMDPNAEPMPQPGSPDEAAASAAASGEVMVPQMPLDAAPLVRPAQLPDNPATGQEWNPQNGGL